MKHVFVETNWVVEYAAPAHLRVPTAVTLAQRAEAGEIQMYVPSVCLGEARLPIRKKSNPRIPADSVRTYVAWATKERTLNDQDCATVRRVLDQYEASVLGELEDLEERLRRLREHRGIEVFSLSEQMLVRAAQLSTENLDLKPFDQAILAAVLVKAEALRGTDDEVCFCELDADLQPWDKNGRSRQPLTALYDSAGVWVYGDFAMENPPKRRTLDMQ